MAKTISVLIIIILLLGFSVIALEKVTSSGTFKKVDVTNNWVYAGKTNKITSHKYCTQDSKGKSWAPSVVAYHEGGKFNTKWKECVIGKDGTPDAKATGCVTSGWTLANNEGAVLGPFKGCAMFNEKGKVEKGKPGCPTVGAYHLGNKYGTQKVSCTMKGDFSKKRAVVRKTNIRKN